MLLVDIKENQGWLLSKWKLTYRTGWDNILKACGAVMNYYEGLQILVDNVELDIKNEKKLRKVREGGFLTFRGISTIVKIPVMITFYNQSDVVEVNVAMATEEFSTVDYEKFNKSLCQYMDSIELAMYR